MGRPRITLIEPAFTSIGTYHLDHFVGNPERLVRAGRRF
jgi:hypothetical protein